MVQRHVDMRAPVHGGGCSLMHDMLVVKSCVSACWRTGRVTDSRTLAFERFVPFSPATCAPPYPDAPLNAPQVGLAGAVVLAAVGVYLFLFRRRA